MGTPRIARGIDYHTCHALFSQEGALKLTLATVLLSAATAVSAQILRSHFRGGSVCTKSMTGLPLQILGWDKFTVARTIARQATLMLSYRLATSKASAASHLLANASPQGSAQRCAGMVRRVATAAELKSIRDDVSL